MTIDQLRSLLKARRDGLEQEHQKTKAKWVASGEKDDIALQLANHWGGRVDEIDHWLQALAPVEELVGADFLNSGRPIMVEAAQL